MPELPEVQTTVTSLQKVLPRLVITDVWTDLATMRPTRADYKETLKYLPFFKKFRTIVNGAKIKNVERRAKNILINLSNGRTILVHMKMTGHLLYGTYKQKGSLWQPASTEKNEALRDTFNRFIHVVFSLSNKKHLVLCDARKFAKITVLPTQEVHTTKHLAGLGPEPLGKDFSFTLFTSRLLLRPKGKIKTVLMDQPIISGIGNIYSDEALWLSGIHPEQTVATIPKEKLKILYLNVQKVLTQGINFGGDSTSDYRNIDGKPGKFHHHHNVYHRKGELCRKKGCRGVILRKVIGGRGAHFCSVHQRLLP